MSRRTQRGQAAVELALCLPLVVLLLLAAVQTGVVVRDQILVIHAGREAARAAAVSADRAAVERAATGASGLAQDRLSVEVGARGGAGSAVRVAVRYVAPTEVPLIGPFLPDVVLRAVTTMRVEV